MAVHRSLALAGATGSVDITEWVPETPAPLRAAAVPE
jgi:hypothetical protein